jgi:Alkylmercury lyase
MRPRQEGAELLWLPRWTCWPTSQVAQTFTGHVARLLLRMNLDFESSMDKTPPYPAQLLVGVTSDRIATVSRAARAVHRAVLTAFATTGRAPDQGALARALPAGHDVAAELAQLHDRDVIRLDEDTSIRAAYPFSAVPTAHLVAIEDGPTVYAMCAIDALGIAYMLGLDIAISSTDPESGEAVNVSIQQVMATWQPHTSVVYVGSISPPSTPDDCCPPKDDGRADAAADRCCTAMNFFAMPDTATEWQAKTRMYQG